jgi:hypothetical protein
MQATQNVVAKTHGETAVAEPFKLQKRIGSTVYSVNAYFSNSTSESLGDKILRLAKNDGLDFQSETADQTRTGRLPERSSAK